MEHEFGHLFQEAYPLVIRERYVHDDTIREAHLLKVFPEAKDICKSLLKKINLLVDLLNDEEWELEKEQLPYREQFFAHAYLIENPMRPLLIQKKRIENILRWSEMKQSFLEKKEKILSIPISDYVKFNRQGFAKCLWHEEKSPSMKYNVKINKVHCFGCEINADIIDVVKKLNNVSFKEAYLALSRDIGLGG